MVRSNMDNAYARFAARPKGSFSESPIMEKRDVLMNSLGKNYSLGMPPSPKLAQRPAHLRPNFTSSAARQKWMPGTSFYREHNIGHPATARKESISWELPATLPKVLRETSRQSKEANQAKEVNKAEEVRRKKVEESESKVEKVVNGTHGDAGSVASETIVSKSAQPRSDHKREAKDGAIASLLEEKSEIGEKNGENEAKRNEKKSTVKDNDLQPTSKNFKHAHFVLNILLFANCAQPFHVSLKADQKASAKMKKKKKPEPEEREASAPQKAHKTTHTKSSDERAEIAPKADTGKRTQKLRFRKYSAEDFSFIRVLGRGSFGKVRSSLLPSIM
ncbi:hypothetical protein B4U79_08724 [Dinothrombium tinctorium]|uniref:Uncharacterized protein n=1 Tax=Dinothrombium tinctorium TaxID=1965070 RepID=A0A3S3P778_9ACAR|nr:hypothetical protein B4U79_04617 [Dinothrombium tinctorium]RWS11516.1 hypothetical protein B4U79_08724 [Dinothrombium tinctorium]